VRVWEAGVATYQALQTSGNLIRESCRGKRVLEIGSGSGLLGRPLENVSSTAILTEVTGCVSNLGFNVAQNCSSSKVSCQELDVSDSAQIREACRWPIDTILGADLCYDPNLVVDVVQAFRILLEAQPRRTAFLMTSRRSEATFGLLNKELQKCADTVAVQNVTEDVMRHLGAFPFCFWDFSRVVVHKLSLTSS
jgi:protein-lysine N-methyltransferase EEF2KMT